MATIVKYLEYTIHLTNKSQAETLQATYAGGIFLAPTVAASSYAAPIQLVSEKFSAPCVRSPYILKSGATDFPVDQQAFTRKVGGWFGLSFLFGTTYNYRWVGKFVYVSSTTPEVNGTPTEVVAIAQRRFMVSFDRSDGPEYISMGADAQHMTRAASRHADGMGFACRAAGAGQVVTMSPTDQGAAASKQAWERFYLRVNVAPTVGECRIWQVLLNGGANRGATLYVTPDLKLTLKNCSDASVETTQATSADILTVGTWYRVDILHKSSTPGNATVKIYLRRKLIITATIGVAVGMGTNSNHVSSKLGLFSFGAGETAEIDFDDWVCADWPTEDSGHRYTGLDWLNGSRVRAVPIKQFNAGNAWAGDYRYLNQINPVQADTNAVVSSSTSGAALVGDVEDSWIDQCRGAIGAVAFYVAYYGRQQTAGSGTLGWRFNGLLDLAAITEATTFRWQQRLYRPSGLTAPVDITPLELHHIKAANANLAQVYSMCAIVEMIGTFGDEDIPRDTAETRQPDSVPARNGLHNAPYPETPWAYATLAPVSPVVVHSGTYVGTGTGVDLTFRTNVNFLFIRRSATSQPGCFWWTSLNGGHKDGERQVHPGTVVQALTDPNYVADGVEDSQQIRTVIRICGDHAAVNASGQTYEYVAVEDPGGRFMINGQFVHDSAITSFANALKNTNFTPEYAFFHAEIFNTVTTFSRYAKGRGHGTNSGSIMNAAESATVAAFTQGVITSKATLNIAQSTPIGYSAWRRDDGSSDANRFKVVKIGTYTGDGAASRTISFENPTGLRPLFAIVTPHNAQSYERDPAHTGTNSTPLGGGVFSTTAITAGAVDGFTVGSALNSNGVDHEYFVLMGSATAGNNGWSIDGEFAYVEPDAPTDGFDPTDPDEPITDPAPTDPDPDPGPGDDDDCDAGDVCVEATTRMVNLALLRLGVQFFLTNYCTQTTKEAQVAQKVFEVAARYTLRAFPWPFATKYATLSLALTQPTNDDWTYSYRLPTDCVYVRRIVVPRNRALNPDPPPFMLSSDSSGGLLFSNIPTSVTIEYTCRPTCVSYVADALFTEALAWRLAAEMGPGLSRMGGIVEQCLANFRLAIEKAESDIKPGVPGEVPAADASDLDTTNAQIAANIAVINRALLRIGARTIANYSTDQSKEAIAARLIFEPELRATLRDFPWAFETVYYEPVLVAGSFDDPLSLDWVFSFRLPTDCVMVRRLVTENGRAYEPNPDLFRCATDQTGGLLYCNIDDPTIEYTARRAGTVLRADDKFRDAFAWRLAAALAPALAQADPEEPQQRGRGPEAPQQAGQRNARKDNKVSQRFNMARYAMAMYQSTLESAKVTDANEKQEDKPGDADWILGRE